MHTDSLQAPLYILKMNRPEVNVRDLTEVEQPGRISQFRSLCKHHWGYFLNSLVANQDAGGGILILPEPLFHNLKLMNCGIVILENV